MACRECNLFKVILHNTHNHPSGSVQPSAADHALTRNLKSALGLLDVQVLDHIIVTQGASHSMAEEGQLG